MIERIKEFLSPKDTETPKDWEDQVSRSLDILNSQVEIAETARKNSGENFMQIEHAGWVRGRIGNFKDLVLETAAKERSIMAYPKHISVESDRRYFYLPAANKVIIARDELVANGIGKVTSVPNLTTARDIDETIWCLDKKLIENIVSELMSRLPGESSTRILSKTS